MLVVLTFLKTKEKEYKCWCNIVYVVNLELVKKSKRGSNFGFINFPKKKGKGI